MAKVFPEVFLIGNGLNRCYAGDSWDQLIRKLSVRDDLPSEMDLPFPLQIILATNGHVTTGMKAAKKELKGVMPEGEYLQLLQRILSSGFHDILTTNYSYDMEQAAFPKEKLTKKHLLKMASHTGAVDKNEHHFLLHSYNKVKFGKTENRIWHIHGEARKPEGMIIGHYDYAALLSKMKHFSDKRAGEYGKCIAEGKTLPDDSWLDSFIMGNVYVLGFGFDQSEFDLWWLLNRKSREKAPHGKLHFYEPDAGKAFDEKRELMRIMDVDLCDLGVRLSADQEMRNKQYHDFYWMALNDILKKKTEGK